MLCNSYMEEAGRYLRQAADASTGEVRAELTRIAEGYIALAAIERGISPPGPGGLPGPDVGPASLDGLD